MQSIRKDLITFRWNRFDLPNRNIFCLINVSPLLNSRFIHTTILSFQPWVFLFAKCNVFSLAEPKAILTLILKKIKYRSNLLAFLKKHLQFAHVNAVNAHPKFRRIYSNVNFIKKFGSESYNASANPEQIVLLLQISPFLQYSYTKVTHYCFRSTFL